MWQLLSWSRISPFPLAPIISQIFFQVFCDNNSAYACIINFYYACCLHQGSNPRNIRQLCNSSTHLWQLLQLSSTFRSSVPSSCLKCFRYTIGLLQVRKRVSNLTSCQISPANLQLFISYACRPAVNTRPKHRFRAVAKSFSCEITNRNFIIDPSPRNTSVSCTEWHCSLCLLVSIDRMGLIKIQQSPMAWSSYFIS